MAEDPLTVELPSEVVELIRRALRGEYDDVSALASQLGVQEEELAQTLVQYVLSPWYGGDLEQLLGVFAVPVGKVVHAACTLERHHEGPSILVAFAQKVEKVLETMDLNASTDWDGLEEEDERLVWAFGLESMLELVDHWRQRSTIARQSGGMEQSTPAPLKALQIIRQSDGLERQIGQALILPKLRAPVVLLHGLFGLNLVRDGGYFSGIREIFAKAQSLGARDKQYEYIRALVVALMVAGNRVLIPRFPPTGSVAERARMLGEFMMRETPSEPVHILAHSMGGLDARYMISRLGMAGHVLTLTTVGTPHRGTSFADLAVTPRGKKLAKPVLRFFGITAQALDDITTARCAAFNRDVPDAVQVRYFSIAGRQDGNFTNPEWLLPYQVVSRAEGDNDGVVAVESARYGEDLEIWPGDHLSLSKWLDPLPSGQDRRPRWARITRRLADLGY
jgi:triacylglycerol lipase